MWSLDFSWNVLQFVQFLVEISTFKVDFWMQQVWKQGSEKFTDENTFLEKVM